MRVSQVISLVWIGNVALLGATGWVFWRFWQEKQVQGKVQKAEWPEVKAPDPIGGRWPGPVTAFKHIWETPLHGIVPPPPEATEGPKVPEKSPRQKFADRIQIVSGFQASDPSQSMVTFSDTESPAANRTLKPGNFIDQWQLVEYRIDPESTEQVAVFRFPGDPEGPLEIRSAKPLIPDVGKAGAGDPPLWGDEPLGPLTKERVPKDKVETQAYYDERTNTWFVPLDEQDWWTVWGAEEVLEKTKFVERPQGLEFASTPPRAALNGSRGITEGDVVVSINGVPVRSLKDVLDYLNGKGRGVEVLEVVIERDGAKRTQTYWLKNRRR